MIQALQSLFTDARTHYHWQQKNVDDALLHKVYDYAKMGPTSANCCPLRIIFVKSPEAKQRLKPFLAEGNVEKTMAAPVTAIFAQDMEFYEKFGFLFPHADAKSWFTGSDALIEATASRNAVLQAAYFMIAARGVGLDCGPMSGFDNAGVNSEFFKDKPYRSNFLCNLGYGNLTQLHPRLPRFEFNDVCTIL